jgi:hypothetical protein
VGVLHVDNLMVKLKWGQYMWTIWSYGRINLKWILRIQACLSCTYNHLVHSTAHWLSSVNKVINFLVTQSLKLFLERICSCRLPRNTSHRRITWWILRSKVCSIWTLFYLTTVSSHFSPARLNDRNSTCNEQLVWLDACLRTEEKYGEV